jgi:hypothetical protein
VNFGVGWRGGDLLVKELEEIGLLEQLGAWEGDTLVIPL